MQQLIESLWTEWQKHPGNHEWRTMCYIIENSKFRIDFGYPDQINASEDVSDRRPRIVKEHFPDAKVDYSKPRG
jgi:hypothetical protein